MININDISYEKAIELRIEKQLKLDKLLFVMSSTFINLPADEIDKQINWGIEQICRFLNIERGCLFQVDKDNEKAYVSHIWSIDGVEMKYDEAMRSLYFSFERFPWLSELYLRGESYSFDGLEKLPAEAEKDKEVLVKNGTVSGFNIPLFSGGVYLGALSFGSVSLGRAWTDDLIRSLQPIGEVFANALLRKRSEEKLKKAFTEIKKLRDQMEAERNYLRKEIEMGHTFRDITGQSEKLQSVLRKVKQVATTDTTVLIFGETGTGKELIARAIHDASLRKDRPLIKVDCTTLPANLIESELFGHEKGAFSGAHQKREGRFELANNGTLFLDEIGELPLDLQGKLLRVIQDREFERLGSSKTIKVDVRIIAATNRDLEEECRIGNFRQDLFYRLNVFPIEVPPLRERKEDIPILINRFVQTFSKKFRKIIQRIPVDVIMELENYHWPGNIRELENVMERSVIHSTGRTLLLPDKLSCATGITPRSETIKSLADIERDHIIDTLRRTGGRVSGPKGAALMLKLHPETLRYRMKKLDIHPDRLMRP